MSEAGRRPLWVVLVAATAALIVALFVFGAAPGIALYAGVLLLVAVVVAMLGARIALAFPATPPFGRPVPRQREPEAGVLQLDGLVLRLSDGNPNAFDLHHRVRPLVREIAAARLARHHGLELESRPELAHALVGPRTWELIRPERVPPDSVWNARGWSEAELSELVDELEEI